MLGEPGSLGEVLWGSLGVPGRSLGGPGAVLGVAGGVLGGRLGGPWGDPGVPKGVSGSLEGALLELLGQRKIIEKTLCFIAFSQCGVPGGGQRELWDPQGFVEGSLVGPEIPR